MPLARLWTHLDLRALLHPNHLNPRCPHVRSVDLRSGRPRMHVDALYKRLGPGRVRLCPGYLRLRPRRLGMHVDARLRLHPHLRLMLDRRYRRLLLGHDMHRRRRRRLDAGHRVVEAGDGFRRGRPRRQRRDVIRCRRRWRQGFVGTPQTTSVVDAAAQFLHCVLRRNCNGRASVSYTHLTLPTILRV